MGRLKQIGFSTMTAVTGLFALIWYIGVDKIVLALSTVQFPLLLLLVILMNPAFEILRAFRWRMVLTPVVKNRSLSIVRVYAWVLFGDFINWLLVFGVEGDFAKAKLLGMQQKNAFAPILTTVGLERVLDGLTVTGIGIAAICLLNFHTATNFLLTLIIILTVGTAVIAFAAFGIVNRNGAVQLIEASLFFAPDHLKLKLLHFIEGLIDGLHGFASLGHKAIYYVLETIALWSIPIITYVLLFSAMGLSEPLVILMIGSVVMTFSAVTPSPPLSIGSYHIIWTATFVALGMPAAIALATAIISHLCMLVWRMPVGLLVSSWLGIDLKDVLKAAGGK